VRRVLVLSDPPSFDRGEATEKGSLNQRAMRDHNAEAIARLYAGGEGAIVV
jgi:feruloyl-CoA synthase